MDVSLLFSLLAFGAVGGLLGFYLAKFRLEAKRARDYLLRAEVQQTFVGRDVHEQVRAEADLHYENLQERIHGETQLREELAQLRTRLTLLHQQEQANREAFERRAEEVLREKSAQFSAENAKQLTGLLSPLRDRIQTYEQQIQQRFVEETRDRSILRDEIRRLQELNQQIGAEANNLAGALRGSSKVQGDWGEWQLLTLLEASGLEQGTHFDAQSSYRDQEGRQKRPDFVINLPDHKHLVIDCKVSLTAYERYCALEPTDDQREVNRLAHLRSLRQHIGDLAGKRYTDLYQISSPDYLLLFVPIEPALGLALSTDNDIFLEALNKNIVLVSPSTLLATLRTVSYIWKQDKQKRSVQEIARQGGLLYDGFVRFTEELQQVGHRLEQAQRSYESALRKLSTGGTPGATLVGRAEKLRRLGARTKKKLAPHLLEEE